MESETLLFDLEWFILFYGPPVKFLILPSRMMSAIISKIRVALQVIWFVYFFIISVDNL